MTNIPDIRDQAEVFDGNTVFESVFILDKLDYDFTKSGTIEIQNLQVVGVTTFAGDITVDEITVRNVDVAGIATVNGNIIAKSDLYLTGALVDTSGDTGTSGKLLESTGSGTNWVAANATSVANAINVGVNLNSSGADHFISFFGASSGNQPNRVGSQFKYNPATNTMSGINHAGTSTFNNINTTGITTTQTLRVKGQLRDGDGNFGSAGQVLTSDGTDTKWDASSNLPAGSSAQVAITDVTSGTPRILLSTGSGTQKDVLSNSSLTYNTSTQVIGGKISSLSNHDTDDLGEGSTNLYHTTARARSSVSASGDLAYNSSTGVFSVNVPSAFQIGMIVLWSGNTGSIPTGFALCNGQTVNGNTTPNLTDRFVVGAGNGYGVGASGGSANSTLVSHSHTINNHTHTYSATTNSDSHTHTSEITGYGVVATGPRGFGFIGLGGPGGYPGGYPDLNTDSHSHTISGTTSNPSNTGTNSQGSSSTNTNLPPYYALCYIMKV